MTLVPLSLDVRLLGSERNLHSDITKLECFAVIVSHPVSETSPFCRSSMTYAEHDSLEVIRL